MCSVVVAPASTGGEDIAFASGRITQAKPRKLAFHSKHSLYICTFVCNQKPQGFDTIALHGGYDPDPSIVLGLGQGAPRGVPVYRTTPYIFKNTEHAANLFKLKELGNIYSRLVSVAERVICIRLK